MLTLASLAAPMALGPSWLDPNQLLDSVGPWALWVAAGVIFAECGLLLGFFLPGDSLLFTVGLFVRQGAIPHNLLLCCIVLTVAAFAGNVVGYEIGRASGPAIFNRPKSRIFKQKYVDQTVAFFDTYGSRAILLARFVPIVRTFITVTAGVAQMDRRRYFTYSGIGAVAWATGVTVLGYLLGSIALVRNHIEVMLLLVVLISVVPVGLEVLRARMSSAKKAGEPAAPAGGAASTADARTAGESRTAGDAGTAADTAEAPVLSPRRLARLERAANEDGGPRP